MQALRWRLVGLLGGDPELGVRRISKLENKLRRIFMWRGLSDPEPAIRSTLSAVADELDRSGYPSPGRTWSDEALARQVAKAMQGTLRTYREAANCPAEEKASRSAPSDPLASSGPIDEESQWDLAIQSGLRELSEDDRELLLEVARVGPVDSSGPSTEFASLSVLAHRRGVDLDSLRLRTEAIRQALFATAQYWIRRERRRDHLQSSGQKSVEADAIVETEKTQAES